MLIGYARVSTDDQNLSLLKGALVGARCDRIFEDRLSGARADRPGLPEALSHARSGDTLVFWRLDRLSRSLKDLIEMVGRLESLNISLIRLHESIKTSSSTGKLVFHLFGALAEFERNLIRERTRAGLPAARVRGRKGGRPKALDRDKRGLVDKLYNEKRYTICQICEMMSISKPTRNSRLG